MKAVLATIVLATALLAALSPAYAAAPVDEIKLGKEASAELEKQSKLLKDEAVQKRVNDLGQHLAAIANEVEVPATYGSSKIQKFEFVFKVLDDKDVNALSMPGGFIYVNKGLIDYVQSDDELAGVLAHEIAHVAHHHMIPLIKEQSKANNQMAIALLATILTGAPATDVGNVLMGARFVMIARLNGYSRKAETDADVAGLQYLVKSKYSPVGMLTFMERLARDEIGRPGIEWGVFQTHPNPGDRSRELISRLTAMGIKIDRRAVTKASVAEARKVEGGAEGQFGVWIGDGLLFAPSAASGATSEERANATAKTINGLLERGVRLRDLSKTDNPPAVTLKGETLFTIEPGDSKANGDKSDADIIKQAHDLLYKTLLAQDMERIY